MIRIVVDTNVLVSALLQPQGFPAEILIEALRGERVQLCVSADIYAEYEEVIRRPRFKRSAWEVDGALRAIREQALLSTRFLGGGSSLYKRAGQTSTISSCSPETGLS